MIARIITAALFLLFTNISLLCGAECSSGGRYEDNGNGTVLDCRTGLVWLKDANCTDTSNSVNKTNGYINWNDSLAWVAGLGDGICSLTDGSSAGAWRLPTRTEWMTMLEYAKAHGYTNPALTNATGSSQWTNGDAFLNVQAAGKYWTSTVYPSTLPYKWFVNMNSGLMGYSSDAAIYYVWPVRGGLFGTFGDVTVQ
jgi:hypothetical protein